MLSSKLKILHINYGALGGASRAATRINNSLAHSHYVRSQLLSIDGPALSSPHTESTIPHRSIYVRRTQSLLRRLYLKSEYQSKPQFRSIAWPTTGLSHKINQLYFQGEIDLVNLHWLGDNTLSIRDISLIKAPLVWTLHDQWLFAGAEHYIDQTAHSMNSHRHRFIEGYSSANRPDYLIGFDINQQTWRRKWNYLNKPINLICPSQWMLNCASASRLCSTWPMTVIPNPLDTSFWHPLPQASARTSLGIPLSKKVLLFGAIGAFSDPRKGFELLQQSLEKLSHLITRELRASILIATFGQSQMSSISIAGFDTLNLGSINDDVQMRNLYSAADILLLPSRIDNLPNVGTEAHSCGLPIVCFDIGGMRDIVSNGQTGFLAKPFSTDEYAYSILETLKEDALARMSDNSRRKALSIWNEKLICKKYEEFYFQASETLAIL